MQMLSAPRSSGQLSFALGFARFKRVGISGVVLRAERLWVQLMSVHMSEC